MGKLLREGRVHVEWSYERRFDQRAAGYFSGDIEAIILYGSVARNESTSESDIDIAVIIKREMDDEKTGTFYRLEEQKMGKG